MRDMQDKMSRKWGKSVSLGSRDNWSLVKGLGVGAISSAL